jgi:hypothetical protein
LTVDAARSIRDVNGGLFGHRPEDRVLELLDSAYAEHSIVVVEIKVDPIFDWIRSDPRFEDFLRRV